MSRDVPTDWISSCLGDILSLQYGKSLPERSRVAGAIPVYGSSGLVGYHFEAMVPGPGIVVGRKGTVGSVILVKEDFWPIDTTYFVVPKNGCDLRWIEYILTHLDLVKLSEATGVPGLNRDKAERCMVSVPPLPEQRRIAEILSSVDEAIHATQAVIEQTRTVKQGVLEILLRQGFKSHRYRSTEIGEIPEHWNLVNLESLLADVESAMRSGPFGSALLKGELVEEGIPLLGIDNVQVERFDRRFKRFVTAKKYQELRRYAVRANDVMITIMGTVGRCCVVPDDIGAALSSKHVWTLTFDNSRYLPDLLCWQLNYAPWTLQEFMRTAQGGVMSAINSSVLRGVRVPVPPMDEQHQIRAVLVAFNDIIAVEDKRLVSLNASKAALMTDLLTGRRRVSDNLLLAAE